MKISTMVMMVLSPMPPAITSSFLSKESARFWTQATSSAARNTTTMGML